jgi:hypothetical protein
MQNWWTIQELGRMKQVEILKEAEIYRIVEEAQSKRLKSHEFLCYFLKKLGKLLVNWGSFLQERYGATVQNPLP